MEKAETMSRDPEHGIYENDRNGPICPDVRTSPSDLKNTI
jgi:hypothetical protein